MKLIKYKADGGDADFTFGGFFVLNDIAWEKFKEVAKELFKGFETHARIKMDCDDHLSILCDSYEDYIEFFTAENISENDFKVLEKYFKHKNGFPILSSGEQAGGIWVFVTDSDLFNIKYSDASKWDN